MEGKVIPSCHFIGEVTEDEVVVRERKLARVEFKPATKTLFKSNPSVHDCCISNPARGTTFPGCPGTRKANHRLGTQVTWTYLDAAANATARAAVASSNFFLFFSSINCFSTKLRASCSAFSFFSNWLIFCLSFCFTCTALCNLHGNGCHPEFYNYKSPL